MKLFSALTILLFLLISISLASPKSDILKLNQEIEDIFFQTQNFEFPHDFTRINDLMGQCDHLDYLIGESELLLLKMQQAIALGDEDLIYEWNRSYEQKVEQAIKYGMQDKELYYKFLSLSILTMIDGFEYQRESIEKLLEQAKRQKDHSTEAYILFSLFQNLSNDDKDKADDQLNQLFSEHNTLKESWTYIAYMNIKGINVLLEPEDQADETPPIPQEIETLVYQAYQLIDKEKYNEALPIFLEANDK